MRNLRYLTAILLAIFSMTVFAHHPAEGIVDEDVYEMIDGMVADTPHADLTFDVMDEVTSDMTMTEITTTIDSQTLVSLDRMLDDGLLTYVGMLDGDVSVSIDFNADSSVTMTITQVEQAQ